MSGAAPKDGEKPPSTRETIKDFATVAAAAFTLIGALWFGVLSWSTTVAYGGIGVTPREVGLGSGTVLAQAGAGFAIFFFLYLAMGVGGRIYVLRAWKATPEARSRLWRNALILAVGIGIATCVLAGVSGVTARGELSEGRVPFTFWFLPVPWRAETADVEWVGTAAAKPDDLPECALFLGQDGATAVLYAAGGAGRAPDGSDFPGRTFRLPAASLSLVIVPGRQACPPP